MSGKNKSTQPEPTAPAPSKPGTIAGFRPAPRRVVCAWDDLAPAEGAGPLWARLERITYEQEQAIPWGTRVPYEDLWRTIAPYILDWNVEGRDAETGEPRILPPPAEAGPAVFSRCDRLIAAWLGYELRFLHQPVRSLIKPVEPPAEMMEQAS